MHSIAFARNNLRQIPWKMINEVMHAGLILTTRACPLPIFFSSRIGDNLYYKWHYRRVMRSEVAPHHWCNHCKASDGFLLTKPIQRASIHAEGCVLTACECLLTTVCSYYISRLLKCNMPLSALNELHDWNEEIMAVTGNEFILASIWG